jgi:hypothetical protein
MTDIQQKQVVAAAAAAAEERPKLHLVLRRQSPLNLQQQQKKGHCRIWFKDNSHR